MNLDMLPHEIETMKNMMRMVSLHPGVIEEILVKLRCFKRGEINKDKLKLFIHVLYEILSESMFVEIPEQISALVKQLIEYMISFVTDNKNEEYLKDLFDTLPKTMRTGHLLSIPAQLMPVCENLLGHIVSSDEKNLSSILPTPLMELIKKEGALDKSDFKQLLELEQNLNQMMVNLSHNPNQTTVYKAVEFTEVIKQPGGISPFAWVFLKEFTTSSDTPIHLSETPSKKLLCWLIEDFLMNYSNSFWQIDSRYNFGYEQRNSERITDLIGETSNVKNSTILTIITMEEIADHLNKISLPNAKDIGEILKRATDRHTREYEHFQRLLNFNKKNILNRISEIYNTYTYSNLVANLVVDTFNHEIFFFNEDEFLITIIFLACFEAIYKLLDTKDTCKKLNLNNLYDSIENFDHIEKVLKTLGAGDKSTLNGITSNIRKIIENLKLFALAIIKSRTEKNLKGLLGMGFVGPHFNKSTTQTHLLQNKIFLNFTEKLRDADQSRFFLELLCNSMNLKYLKEKLKIEVIALGKQQGTQKLILQYLLFKSIEFAIHHRDKIGKEILKVLEQAESISKFISEKEPLANLADIPDSYCVEPVLTAATHHIDTISVMLGNPSPEDDPTKEPLTDRAGVKIELGEHKRKIIPPCTRSCQIYGFVHAFWGKLSGFKKEILNPSIFEDNTSMPPNTTSFPVLKLENDQPKISVIPVKESTHQFGELNLYNMINKILNAIGTKDNSTIQIGDIYISRQCIRDGISESDNDYTNDVVNLLLHPLHQISAIKVYAAIKLDELKDYSNSILKQNQRYAFVSINVPYSNKESQNYNHWVGLIIDKQYQLLFYLDPAKGIEIPQQIEDFKLVLKYKESVVCNTIDFQDKEKQAEWLRHCGVYLLEIFYRFSKCIDDKSYISGSSLPNIGIDRNSISLESALSAIPSGDAENIIDIRKKHISIIYSIVVIQQIPAIRDLVDFRLIDTETRLSKSSILSGHGSTQHYPDHSLFTEDEGSVVKKTIVISIIGDNHTDPEDIAFKNALIERSRNGEIILLSESSEYGIKNKDNAIGIEDLLILSYAKLTMGYIKNIKIMTKEELHKVIVEQTKGEKLDLNKEQRHGINFYIHVIFLFLLRLDNNKLDNISLDEIINNLKDPKNELQSEYTIFIHFLQNYYKKEIVINKVNMWDDSESYPEELIEWFFKHKLYWDNIVRVFTYWLINAINRSKLPYASSDALTEAFHNKCFKQKPTNDERIEIVFQLSSKITTDLRNQVYIHNLKRLAAIFDGNKPIYFIVGDEHIKGIQENITNQKLPFIIFYYNRPNKPPEFSVNQWRKYPTTKILKYNHFWGHQVCFFNIDTKEASSAERYYQHLKQLGFDVYRGRTPKGDLSVVVDKDVSKSILKL